MLTVLAVLSALVWAPILLHHIIRRAFIVLLIWLLVAPTVTNLINGDTNPFIRSEQETEQQNMMKVLTRGKITNTNIKSKELLEPNRLLFGAFLLVFLLNAAVKRNRMIPLDGVELCMVVFSLVIVINTLFLSTHLANSLRLCVDAFIVPFLGYYVARRLVTSEERFHQLGKFLCYLGLFIVTCCFIERLVHSGLLYRLNGPFATVGLTYVVLTTTFYAALEGSQIHPYLLHRALLYLAPMVIVLTWTRANWVAFLAGLWICLFFGRSLINPSKKLRWIGVALIAIPLLMLAIPILLSSSDAIEARVTNEGSVTWRLERWMIALREAVKYPIVGIGMNNTRELFGETTGTYFSSHNSFVTFLTELGAIGFLAYLVVVGSIVRLGLRLYRQGAHPQDQWRGIVVVAVMVAYQMCALFATLLHQGDLGALYVFVFCGGIAGLYGRHHAHDSGHGRSEGVQAPLVLPRPTRV